MVSPTLRTNATCHPCADVRPAVCAQTAAGAPQLDVRLTRSQSGNILDIDFVGGEYVRRKKTELAITLSLHHS